eukprot:CAMPEP_0119310476 /NCGR_PEP_ID=MMETSP1333-20130426/19592_1 /TAXON_ID=418940 /ORGANISM="Scyphosphaera apsteinii, Strain RCC1455" /LENGTH=162 /DNA_ID=CAMNT_0007314667 /DNA_START=139 /DNA_END=627 /DNA_ORIENTATION=+
MTFAGFEIAVIIEQAYTIQSLEWGNIVKISHDVSMAGYEILMGLLIVCAELHLTCMARYFGFTALCWAKGMFLIYCGLIIASLSALFEQSARGTEIAPIAVGAITCSVGLIHLTCGSICCSTELHTQDGDEATIRAHAADADSRLDKMESNPFKENRHLQPH